MQSGVDHLEHAARILKHVIVPEAEDEEAFAAQVSVAMLVGETFRMLAAVGLDDQRSFETGKIHDVRRDDVLALELKRRQSAVAKH